MTNVTVHNKPSDEIIKNSQNEILIQDKRGRTIGIKKPNFRAQFTLAKVLGDDAKNDMLRGMYFPLYYISSIEGLPNTFVNTRLDLDGLIDRLDEDGYSAVTTALLEHFGDQLIQNEEATKEKIKKLEQMKA